MTTTDPNPFTASMREYEVLALAAEGWTNAEIGAHLFLSEDTVKTHMRKLCKRNSARNRAHIVGLAYKACVSLPRTDEVPRGGFQTPGAASGSDASWATPGASRPLAHVNSRGTPAVFRKVGLIYRAVSPSSAAPPPATHLLRVVHPTDVAKRWEVSISVDDDEKARDRMRLLAGRVFPPSWVWLSRVGPDREVIDGMAAYRNAHELEEAIGEARAAVV